MYVYVQGIFKEIFMDIVNNSPLRDTLKGILYDLTVALSVHVALWLVNCTRKLKVAV